MAEKNNKGMLIAVVVVLAILAGAGIYFMGQGDKDSEPANQQANAAEAAAQTQAAAGDSAQNIDPNAPKPDGIEVKPGNPIVAKVDSKEITRVDVYRFIQTMPANVQQLPAAAVYPMAMEQVINTRIVQNKAENAKVEESDAYKAELEAAKQQLARNVYLQQEVSKKISEDKLKKSYKEYSSKLPDVKERRARHILVETEDKAKAIIDKLNKGGDFEALAKELSTGPTGPKGGDLGYFAEGEMVPEFSKQVFSMKKGDVTKEPVKTQFGYHVIKVEDIRDRPKPTFEQLQPALEAELRREILTELLKDWRDDSKIVQFDINGDPLKDGANALGIVPPKATATN